VTQDIVVPEDSETPNGPRTVRSVIHAVKLLKALSRSNSPATLSDLAASVGLSKPSTFNLLKTLEVEGLVAKDQFARYQLTWGVYELGSAVVRTADVSRIARAHLDKLAEQTGEAVLLAIIDETSVLYLDRGQAADTFAMVANVGRRSPLHTNASGKVLLAGQPETYIAQLLSGPLDAKTRFTITDPRELRAELKTVTRNGYAVCAQEQEEGLSSIAVPITDYTGHVHAALTIAGPTQRIGSHSLQELLGQLREEANAISEQLGSGGTIESA